MASVADLFQVGDTVWIDSYEGFGGAAVIVEIRDCPPTPCKVKMEDNTQPPFWAHAEELTPRVVDKKPRDSRSDTLKHIGEVRERIDIVIKSLKSRQEKHDLSKLLPPEKEMFDVFTPDLKGLTYGSDEYYQTLDRMPALAHHYQHNSHHPQHYQDGINGMCLIDVVEMLCDWKAATLRHNDGDLRKSIEINQGRFKYSDELKQLLINTAERLGFFDVKK